MRCSRSLASQVSAGKRGGRTRRKLVWLGQTSKPSRRSVRGDPFAGAEDALEIAAIIGEVVERGDSGDLPEAIDIVAVADLVQGSDESGVADEVTDALEAERVSLGKGAGDQDVADVSVRAPERFARRNPHRFRQQDHDPALGATELVQFRGRVAAATGRIGSRDEGQGGLEIPEPPRTQSANGRQ